MAGAMVCSSFAVRPAKNGVGMTRTLFTAFLGLGLAFSLSAKLRASESKPLVIAHRGASGYLPEHTLVAKAMAHAMDPDYIEQDVVLTRDGVPVVLHDHYLDTVTDVAEVYPQRKRADGRYYAIDFLLEEIRGLRVQERFDRKTGAAVFPQRFPIDLEIPSLRVPTLAEELDLIRGMNRSRGKDVGVYVELKSPWFHRDEGADLVGATLEVLEARGFLKPGAKTFLQCFEPRTVKELRARLKDRVPLVLLIEDPAWKGVPGIRAEDLLTRSGLAEVSKYADGIGLPISLLLKPRTQWVVGMPRYRKTPVYGFAREAGLKMHPYTLRADALPAPFRSLGEVTQALFHDLEVDGVFSDHPDQVLDFLVRSGRRKAPRGR